MKSKPKEPVVSVIVPVFNAERYVADAINSILRQTSPASEIIVVDDGSTDASAEVVKSFGSAIIYCYQRNRGAAAARNKGIRLAAGAFLAFLDADDLWTPDKLRRQLDLFEASADIQIVFGKVEQFVSPELDPRFQSRLRPELKRMPGYHVGTMLIETDTFHGVGYFNEELQLGEFIDWFDRAQQSNLRHDMIEDVMMRRRIHRTNQGLFKREFRKDYITVLKAAIDRKRKHGASEDRKPGDKRLQE
jgi:glycosyltransferase involved in cell wall biosynthesis